MSKYLRLMIASFVLLILCAGSALATAPVVEYLGFNPSTFTYTYQVTQTYSVEYGFAELEIDSWVGNVSDYTIWDPVESIPMATWTKAQLWWQESQYVGYKWISSGIPPGPVLEYYQMPPWVGTFDLTVPNTAPRMGTVIARSTEYPESPWVYSLNVPAPVPEPSGLLVLATGAFGFMATIRRRK